MKKIKKIFLDRKEYCRLFRDFESTLPKGMARNNFIADGIITFISVWGSILLIYGLYLLCT